MCRLNAVHLRGETSEILVEYSTDRISGGIGTEMECSGPEGASIVCKAMLCPELGTHWVE